MLQSKTCVLGTRTFGGFGRESKTAHLHGASTKYLVPEFEAAKRAFGINFIFMQDNVPCHKTRKVISFLERKRIPTLDWAPQSPDFNPIENIWNIIKTRRYKKFGVPRSKVELIEQIFKIWEKLTVDDAENCIGNMERRFQEVVPMNGRPTRY